MEIAKYLVAFVAVYSFGGLIADGIVPATARQHLRNPAWPPHAKFHNGQTMLLGIINGAIALVVLFAFRPLTLPLFLVAAASASAYWVAMAARPLGFSPQQLLTYALCVVTLVAALLAVIG